MWVKLKQMDKDFSIPMKFGLGILQLGLGYLVILLAAPLAVEYQVPLWTLACCTCCTPRVNCSSPHRPEHGDQIGAEGHDRNGHGRVVPQHRRRELCSRHAG
jgi:hypothetical protein